MMTWSHFLSQEVRVAVSDARSLLPQLSVTQIAEGAMPVASLRRAVLFTVLTDNVLLLV